MPLIIVFVSTTTRLPACIDHALELGQREALAARLVADGGGRCPKFRRCFGARFVLESRVGPRYVFAHSALSSRIALLSGLRAPFSAPESRV